jgi:RNA polymerase sigma-70 factor (ECF subfamily)
MGVLVSHTLLLQTSDTLGDAELVTRAVGGDRWAREMIYRRHAGSLLAVAVRLLRNKAEAEEVVQDTFVTAFDQLGSLREQAALKSWLWQIAVSLVRRRFRRARLLGFIGLDRATEDATLTEMVSPGARPDQRAELALIDRALSGMRSDLRLAWTLRKVEGLELTEVATMCGCSLATVKRRIAEADVFVSRHLGTGGVS